MGGLIKSEFRKILTTKLWWALMIPTVVIGFGWALGFAALSSSIKDSLSSSDLKDVQSVLGIDSSQWKLGVLGVARSINIATIFPLIFGGLAISSEISNKTITTTFLYAPNRVAALAAKMISYILWATIYGVAIFLSVFLGMVAGAESSLLPDASGWLAFLGVSVLATIMVTLFGVGVGALLKSVPGTVVALLLWFLLIENVLQILWSNMNAPDIAGFLPNGSINGVTGSVAADVFLGAASSVPDYVEEGVRIAAGAFGAQSWWASSLIFLVWVGVAFGGGWAAVQKRDIT